MSSQFDGAALLHSGPTCASTARTAGTSGKKAAPPLKWAGGKRWLTMHLQALYAPHRHRRLVEPFVGGLAVSLALRPERALLADINPHAIQFYLWLQRGFEIDRALANEREFYFRARDRFNELVRCGSSHTKEASELFYYLNRTCFNGLCRFNRSGEFNVPFGRYPSIRYLRDFRGFVTVLERWEFLCSDFSSLPVDAADFIYADPPYDVQFRQYSSDPFEWKDQVRLAEQLQLHPGPVVASNQATKRVLDLYKGLGFNIEIVSAPRLIACNGDRTRAAEMLATRNL